MTSVSEEGLTVVVVESETVEAEGPLSPCSRLAEDVPPQARIPAIHARHLEPVSGPN